MADAGPPDGTNPPGLTRRTVIAGAVALAGSGTLLRPAVGRAAPPDVAAPARAGHGAGSRGMDITSALGRDREGRFGLMFKALEPFSPPDEMLHDLAAG